MIEFPTLAMKARGARFLPQRPRSVLLAGGALLCGLMVAGVWWFVEAGRASALNDAQRELMALSRALSEDTDRALQGAEILQTGVVARLQAMGVATASDLARVAATAEFHELLNQKASDILYVERMAIADANGDILSDSKVMPPPKVNLADRSYFQMLKSDPTRRSFVGDPSPGKVTNAFTIHLAARISGPKGEFLGLVLSSIKVAYFETAFSTFVMPGGRVSLFGENGVLLARAPHIDKEFQKLYSADPMFNGAAPQTQGVVVLPGVGEGRTERVVGFTRLPRYSLVMTVSKGRDEILAEWNGLARIFYAATAAVLGLIGTTIVVLSRSVDQQRKVAAAEQARVAAEVEAVHAGRFEIALNNMLQGLCMFDKEDRLIVCNARYGQMYSLPAQLARPGTAWRDIVAHRIERFGYRNLDLADVVAQHQAIDLTRAAETRTRELGDGRTILIRHQPITEGGWVATHEDITERRKADERLSHMARHDALTGLPNRILLQERFAQAVERLAEGEQFAVLCLDLDHFKETNDTLGHPVGDALLRDFATRLKTTLGAGDTVARIGGDEFAIVQVAIAGADAAADLARRILAVATKPFEIAGHRIDIGASVGIACAPRDGDDGALLLRKADIALYRAKSDGRRDFRFFEAAMDNELQSRRLLEIALREAVEQESFEVFYQPLLDARSRTIRSFEALVRWRHPERGLVSPAEFIPLAEETGLIVPLGAWVLRSACRQAALWPADVRVSVNLSVHQFKAANLVETVRSALAAAGLAGRRLELEITESVLLIESARTLEILHELRGMGIKIAMDDFGTGYSSLSYLRSFPFDKIKIDQSFVRNLDQRDAQEIVRAISSLGQTLGITTTAEGVETEAQLAAVIETGCIEVQGYLFSKPVPAPNVAALLEKYYYRLKAA
ncbi:MAG: EAL domain-containing protein [Roseiarcus sp.]|jgi:diguanylate cyclase (GGDEF)-like protein